MEKTKKIVPDWYKDSVFYQIYPRSFADSNGDGIGDLQGVINHLDYLRGTEESLGVDAIWLGPIYKSPMNDFGYDVENYRKIDPVFGNMKKFERLLERCHSRGLKLILDTAGVIGTSWKHRWFQESRKSRDNPKSDWYIWVDGRKDELPNNWKIGLGDESAWEWMERKEQYLLKAFLSKKYPQLNWRNPQVREEIYDVLEFWLRKGIDGFRLDYINALFKDEDLRDNPEGMNIFDRDRPETLKVMEEFRELFDEYGAVSVGEIFSDNQTRTTSEYCGIHRLHMSFNFDFINSEWNPEIFKGTCITWYRNLSKGAWPALALSNHDVERYLSRCEGGSSPEGVGKVIAGLLLTLKGTPFIYQGQEIGMTNLEIPKSEWKDPLGRDGERTPMQWKDSEYAGFSSTEPWLPVNENYKDGINVEDQWKDPDSLLNFYKSLLDFRRENELLRRGEIEFPKVNSDNVLPYLRVGKDGALMVVLNFFGESESFKIIENRLREGVCVFSNRRDVGESVGLKGEINLTPYEVSIFSIG